VGHRRGTTEGKIGFHGGKVTVHRPRVRSFDGHEVALPSWTAAQAEDWLGRWAMNLMDQRVDAQTQAGCPAS
jgi:putative transposase